MLIFNKIKDLQDYLTTKYASKIGFVPTMGALHSGHLSLVKEAQKSNDIVVVSIFVNPIQFNNPEDFEKYPQTLEADIEKLKAINTDVLFAPYALEMYPLKTSLKFDFGHLENVLEGKFRPGHFSGVAIVVTKLFNIVKPNTVYFGQKDYQQCAVIKTLINDLSFNIEMTTVPTIRESSGLAMSSRNMRLTATGLETASNIYKTLSLGKKIIKNNLSVTDAKIEMNKFMSQFPDIEIEYLEVCNAINLESVEKFDSNIVICFAGYLEGVRLIDNIIINRPNA